MTVERAKWAALAMVTGLLVALPYLADSFFVNMATQALYLGLLALSINLIAGYGGMVTLGQAGISGVAGYTVGIGLTHFNLSLGVALPVGLLATVVVAAMFGALAVRTSGVYFLMITLAEGMIVWGIVQRWTSVTGGDNGLRGITRPEFALEYWEYYYFTLVVVVISTALIALVTRSMFGLSLKGIRESAARMAPLGYNVTLHKLVAFTIAGAAAGVAGLLLAMFNQFISPPAVHVKASADGLLMAILGGMGTIPGAFIGSTVFVLVTNYVSGFVDRWPTLLGLIFVLAILFARDGIAGSWNRWVWAPVVRKLSPAEASAAVEATVGAGSNETGR